MTKITIPDTADLLARIEALETMNATLARELRQIKAKIAIKGGSASHPTMWAYEQACAALDKHRDRADRAAARIAELEADLQFMTDCRNKWQDSATTRAYRITALERALSEIIMEATSRNHAIDIARRARAEGGE